MKASAVSIKTANTLTSIEERLMRIEELLQSLVPPNAKKAPAPKRQQKAKLSLEEESG